MAALCLTSPWWAAAPPASPRRFARRISARVTLIESGTLGGTCVNVGCVPSKTLLRAADAQHRAAHHGFEGVRTTAQRPDFAGVMAQKDALVAALRQGKYADVIAHYPSVTVRRGRALINQDLSVTIDGDDLKPDRLIVTTGASPWAPPIPGLAETGYLTSTEALALTTLPTSIIVIGGSAVGLEIAQLYARLGSRVTVLEAMHTLVPLEDVEIGTALAEHLREEGIDVHVGAAIGRASRDEGGYAVSATIQGRSDRFAAEQLLVATGRRANTRGFGLEEAGVELGDKGEIRVNEYLETSRSRVYAAGDVVGDPMFVYVAAYAGNLAAENAIRGDSRQSALLARHVHRSAGRRGRRDRGRGTCKGRRRGGLEAAAVVRHARAGGAGHEGLHQAGRRSADETAGWRSHPRSGGWRNDPGGGACDQARHQG